MGTCKTKPKQIQQQDKVSNFNFIKPIGKGGFGKVWKVQQKKTKQIYALKVMSKAKILVKKSVNSIMNERNFLSEMNNKFIVNMISAFQNREFVYLLLDYLDGGDLRYYINRKIDFTQDQIKFILKCIIQALDYLHSKQIIHRDIKPQNIIFDQYGYCRVTDLGVSRKWKQENSNQTSGTPGYMCPEVILKQNHSFTADYFAVGVIGYELVMKKRPYLGRNRKQIREQMMNKQVKIPMTNSVSKQCIDFINRLIQRKYKNRLGYYGINEIKSHPWLRMTAEDQKKFKNQQLQAPFIPNGNLQNHNIIKQISEPNEREIENSLLLKCDDVQYLFKDYEYKKINKEQVNDQKQKLKITTQRTNQDSQYINNSI